MGKTETHRKDAVQAAKTRGGQGQENTRDLSQKLEELSRYKVSCRTLAVGRKTVTKCALCSQHREFVPCLVQSFFPWSYN